MPYNRPELTELVQETEANISSRLEQGDSWLRRAVLAVLSRVVGGIANGLYGYIGWLAKQLFPETADEEFLELHGRIRKIPRKAAAQAEGPGLFQGDPGAVMPAGTAIKRSDGQEYETTADATADDDGLASAPMRALEAGSNGNAVAGITLSLVSTVPGFQNAGKVGDMGLTGGLDLESVQSWRGRIMFRWQNPERSGSVADWERWAMAVPGVSKAYCQPHWMGIGSIGMIIVGDAANGQPIPDAVTVARCQAYLEDPQRRPPGPTDIYVIAAQPLPVDVEVKDLEPDDEATRAAVKAELADLFTREAEPGQKMPRSHISEAVSVATGEYDHTLVLPERNVVARPYELPILGEVSFT